MSWMTDYVAEQGEIAQRATRAAAIYQQYREPIEKYRGGLPAGFVAACIQRESDGKMNASGDASLEEVGLMQVTKSIPEHFGYDPKLRYEAEWNIFFGCLELNYYASYLHGKYYPFVQHRTSEQWMLARLGFAVGLSGTDYILRESAPFVSGNVYNAIMSQVDNDRFSSDQGKRWFRAAVVPLTWQVGVLVKPDRPGVPVKVPDPNGSLDYTVPADGPLTPSGIGTVSSLMFAGGILALATARPVIGVPLIVGAILIGRN